MIAIVFLLLVILVVGLGIFKKVSGQGTSDNSYTPFDHITGQADTEFHVEKGDEEEGRD